MSPVTQKNKKRIYNPLKKRQAVYEQVSRIYAPILPFIQTIDLLSKKQQLKEYIMLQNDAYNKSKKGKFFRASYHDLPFVQYKYLLDKRINQLKRYTKKLTTKINDCDTILERNIQNLVAQLEQLNEIIVKFEEYRQEKLVLAEQGRNSSFGILKFGFTTLIRKLIFV